MDFNEYIKRQEKGLPTPEWDDAWEEVRRKLEPTFREFGEIISKTMAPGTVSRDLYEFSKRGNSEDTRMDAAKRVAGKMGLEKKRNPIYWERWKEIEGRLIGRLREESPELSILEAFRQRVLSNLPQVSKEFMRLHPTTPPEDVLLLVKRILDDELPKDVFGDDWRKKIVLGSVSENTPIPSHENDPAGDDMLLVDTLRTDDGKDPDELLEEKRQVETIEELMQQHKLTEHEKKVFRIVYQGGTPADAADILGISPGSVRVHLSNARKKMRKAFPSTE